jgi:hypothetical protein
MPNKLQKSENIAEKAKQARREAENIASKKVSEAKQKALEAATLAKTDRATAKTKADLLIKATEANKKTAAEKALADNALKNAKNKINEDQTKANAARELIEKDLLAVKKATEDQKAKTDAANKAIAAQIDANNKAIQAKSALAKADQEHAQLIAKLSADKLTADKLLKNINADKKTIQNAQKAKADADKALAKAIADRDKAKEKALKEAANKAANNAKKASEAAQKAINDAKSKLTTHKSAEQIAAEKIKVDREAATKAQIAKSAADVAATKAQIAKNEAEKIAISAKQAQVVAEKVANDAKANLNNDEQAAKKAQLAVEADKEAAKKAEEAKKAKEIAEQTAKDAAEKAKNAKEAAEIAAIAAEEKAKAAEKVAEKAAKAAADLKGILWPKSTMTDDHVVKAFVNKICGCWIRIKGGGYTSKTAIINDLAKILNEIFDMCGIPQVGTKIFHGPANSYLGLFETYEWEININAEIFNGNFISKQDFYQVVETIYHEGRHAEQAWLICVQTLFEKRVWNKTKKQYEVLNTYSITRYEQDRIFNMALDTALKRKEIPVDSAGNMSKYYTNLLELIGKWSKTRNNSDTKCILSNAGLNDHWYHRYQLIPRELDAFFAEENLRNEFIRSTVHGNDFKETADSSRHTCYHCGGKNHSHLMSNIPVNKIPR